MHLHTFSVPVEGKPHARQCRDCGEPQRYAAPTGHGEFPYIMLMKKEDLRDLLFYVEGPDYDPHGDFSRLMERIDAHLT